MKKLVFILLISCFTIQLRAQGKDVAVDFTRYGNPITNPSYIDRSIVNDIIHDIEKVQRTKSPEEFMNYILSTMEGTPFLENEFLKGTITTVDGKVIRNVDLRYNVFNNKMEVKQKDQLFELTNDLVKRIQMNDRTFDYLKYELDKNESDGYLELISDGNWKLYYRHAKKFKEAQSQKAMEEHSRPAEFRDLPPVYLLLKDDSGKAIGFRNKKELANIFPNHKNEVHSFMKKNRLKTNNAEDLQKLLSYYFSL